MNGNGRIALVGQPQFGHQHVDTGSMVATSATMVSIDQQTGSVQLTSIDGAYRDEQLAACIVGGILAGGPQQCASQDEMVQHAFSLADEIMAEGARRRKPKPEIKSGE